MNGLFVPAPFTFNVRKHHAGHLHLFIEGYDQPLELLHQELKDIGSALMDLYWGTLSVEQICEEIKVYLHSIHYWEDQAFIAWLATGKGFQSITLSDQSIWVLRRGEDPNRYLHIHPGRYSPYTMRVKASTLMTAIGIALHKKARPQEEVTLPVLNQIRSSYLQLSPVKSAQLNERVARLLEWWGMKIV